MASLAPKQRLFAVASPIPRFCRIMKEPTNNSIIKNINLDQLNRKNILMNLGGKEQIIKIAELYGETPGLVGKIKFAQEMMEKIK